MDFFEHQEVARRKTGLLVGYFVLAVVLIIVAIYLTVLLIFFGAEAEIGMGPGSGGLPLMHPGLFGIVAGATLLIVLLGSLYKIASLRSGGAVIAKRLGGVPIDPGTTDLDERKLLNVVEEMALAAGTPVPTVYRLPNEEGINAFAAGFTIGDAVIGVTDGCVRHLTRDQLQGVIAHEFSHILNSDMRLNLRLIGVLHGILVIALIGYAIVRGSSGGRRRSGRDKGGGAIVLLGIGLMVIGYIGVFFGRLIKSAVSRQREYLADSSAVQFTRNPMGIAGALRKIGELAAGSRLQTSRAEEASHLFFGNGVRSWMALLSTHPPLEDRIRRIDPSFRGSFAETPAGDASPDSALAEATAGASQLATPGPARAATGDLSMSPDGITAQAGTMSQAHIAFARDLIAALPASVTERLHDTARARAVVYGLLIDRQPAVRAAQLQQLQVEADPAVYEETVAMLADLERCPASARLPLVDLALPALKGLEPEAYETFHGNVRRLVTADGRMTLFEYALQSVVTRHLAPHFGAARPRRVQHHSLRRLATETSTLLSAVAHYGHTIPTEASRAFEQGAAELQEERVRIELIPEDASQLRNVDAALRALSLTAPRLKRRIVRAVTATIAHDGRVTAEEGDLLRAIADSLDVPVPPLLASRSA